MGFLGAEAWAVFIMIHWDHAMRRGAVPLLAVVIQRLPGAAVHNKK